MAGYHLNKRDKALWLGLLGLSLASAAAYMLWAYPALPDTVPIHWGASGAVDGWGSKSDTIALALLPLALLALFAVVPCLDPRGRSFARFKGVYQGFTVFLTLFMIAVGWTVPLTAWGILPSAGTAVTTFFLTALGVGLTALGNYLPRVKPNYTFGVRLPWTLADEENWRRTHRFAGPVMVAAGAVIVVAGIASPFAPEAAIAIGLVSVVASTLATALYSFLLWRGVIK